MTSFSEQWNISRGVTALIGGGGKTTLMYRLAEELKEKGSVLICTSTKIYPPEQYPLFCGLEAWRREGCPSPACIGTQGEDGKLRGPKEDFSTLSRAFTYVIVEADGAKRLPCKAHASYEPVVPENANKTILVVGIDAVGKPIREMCHRPELAAEKIRCAASAVMTEERLAALIQVESLGDMVFLNKVESKDDDRKANKLKSLLPMPTWIGSLQRGELR